MTKENSNRTRQWLNLLLKLGVLSYIHFILEPYGNRENISVLKLIVLDSGVLLVLPSYTGFTNAHG